MIIHGDCREVLQTISEESIHCVVTSPPYWKQRDYEDARQIGQEEYSTHYLDHMVDVFRELRRVLRYDGTVWLNIGDKYVEGELQGLPWELIFRLRRQKWMLVQEIIWHKPNSITSKSPNRCTPAHEHLFVLALNRGYYFDKEAIKTVYQNGDQAQARTVWTIGHGKGLKSEHFAAFPYALAERCILAGCPKKVCPRCETPHTREIFSERVPTRPGTKTKATKHASVQGNRDPQRHITRTRTVGWEPGCDCGLETVGGTVLDPFCGSGTVGLAAAKLARSFTGIEVNENYIKLAEERIAREGKKGFGLGG